MVSCGRYINRAKVGDMAPREEAGKCPSCSVLAALASATCRHVVPTFGYWIKGYLQKWGPERSFPLGAINSIMEMRRLTSLPSVSLTRDGPEDGAVQINPMASESRASRVV